MYFLRRRHGRKPPEARRETPPAETPVRYEASQAAEPEEIAPARPTVITKRRQRIASPAEEESKPSGTFRAGTLHLGRSSEPQARH
jgi:hypothetical protein